MASASSAEQAPMKVEPEELPDASGTRQGETELGVLDLLPRSEKKRPCFQSPLYRNGFTVEGEVDIAKELDKNIVVQVNNVQLNAWARTLVKKPDGHLYFNSPKRTRWHQHVSTWISVDTVHKYMRDQTVPMWDGTVTALTTPRFQIYHGLRGNSAGGHELSSCRDLVVQSQSQSAPRGQLRPPLYVTLADFPLAER